MRYFLDTEFNGWGGALLSIALVAESGDEFYAVLDYDGPLEPWVERHVLPYLDTVPESMKGPRLSRRDAAEALAYFLAHDPKPHIVADWPEDIALIAMLLTTGSGMMVTVAAPTFEMVALPGFSTAGNSKVPHNALHDARALRDHVVALG